MTPTLPRMRRLWSKMRHARNDADLAEELRVHLELASEDFERLGASPEDARRKALVNGGGVPQTLEMLRDERGLRWLADLGRDSAYACRGFRRAPGFAIVVVATLGLAIGATTTVFALVNAVLLSGLPFEQGDRIVAIATEDASGRRMGVSRPDFDDWRNARSVAGMALFANALMNVSDDRGPAEQLAGTYGTANFFQLVGAAPIIGRDLRSDDDRPGADAAVILSYNLWHERYGGDPAVLGEKIRVNSLECTVVGVMPAGMRFPSNNDLWLPWSKLPLASRTAPRQIRNSDAIGRLPPGITLAQARTELGEIGVRLAHDFPASNANVHPFVVPYNEAILSPRFRGIVGTLMGAVLLLLIIACANIATLQLARAARRSHEMVIRVSLGASRWRVARQLIVEAVVLAGLAGVLGLVLSNAGVRAFDGLITASAGPNWKPYWMALTMDRRVFACLAIISLAAMLICGVVPAVHAAPGRVRDFMNETPGRSIGGVRVTRWTGALLVCEVALTLMLLAGAAFLMRTFLTLARSSLDVDTSHVLTMRINLPLTKFPQTERRAALYRQLQERLGNIGDIQASALTTNPPFFSGSLRELSIKGRPKDPGTPLRALSVSISTGYFDVLRTGLIKGRMLTQNDELREHTGVIVNQQFAAVHFPNEDPIGQIIDLSDQGVQIAQRSAPVTATIVGIVPDIPQTNLPRPSPVVYVPFEADPPRSVYLVIRTIGDSGRIVPVIRETMRAVDPDVPLFGIQPMNELLAQPLWPFRVFGSVFTAFAVIALSLSAVGLYAATAQAVSRRTPEIGVRVALGARPAQVLWLVVRRTMRQLLIALPLGGAGAFAIGRLIHSYLVQTQERDPAAIAAMAVLVSGVALVATLVPARRAVRLDPTIALRDA